MAAQKHKLKKSVKIIFVLLLVIGALVVIITSQRKQLSQLTNQQRATTKETVLLKEQLQEVKESVKFPQKAYAAHVNRTLKKEKLNPGLILQTDERYRTLHYGSGPIPTLEINGCVITALAMVDSWLTKQSVSPDKILSWSGDNYFTDGGTSWSIFSDFAKDHHYRYQDLGDQLDDVIPYLKQNQMVIASAKPGIFTTIGHALVLTHYDKKGVHLLDPADNSSKKHSLTAFSKEQLNENLIHYWLITK